MQELLERQLLTRGRAFTTFLTIENTLASRKKSSRGPHVARGLYVVPA